MSGTWTTQSLSSSLSGLLWNAVCYGNGKFVAIANTSASASGTNCIMTSEDGVTWTGQSSTARNNWKCICYGGGLYVALAASLTSLKVYSSADGVNWTNAGADGSTTYSINWSSIAYGMVGTTNYYVGVANASNTNTGWSRIMYSTDATIWTRTTKQRNITYYSICNGSTGSQGIFVAVGLGAVVTSTDVTTSWSLASGIGTNTWRSVCYSSNLQRFVAVASDRTNRAMYSNNGTTWTTSGSTSVTDGSVWTSVTYGTATGFVAVSNTSVMYSADGITWTNNSINTSLSCVTYGSGLYVAVGNNANVATPSGYVLTNGTISCYVKGCKINTMKGFIPIEELVKDDLLIINNTNNYLPISHIGCKKITVSNLDEPLNCIYKINDNMVTG